jgi:hypothetical protein
LRKCKVPSLPSLHKYTIFYRPTTSSPQQSTTSPASTSSPA